MGSGYPNSLRGRGIMPSTNNRVNVQFEIIVRCKCNGSGLKFSENFNLPAMGSYRPPSTYLVNGFVVILGFFEWEYFRQGVTKFLRLRSLEFRRMTISRGSVLESFWIRGVRAFSYFGIKYHYICPAF